MKENLVIKQITDSKDPVLDTVTHWIYQWWGKDQNFTVQQMHDYYKRSVFADRLPQTYAAYLDGKPVGTFQFGMSDCYVRPDVYPWIKNVYVDHPYRGRGFAGEMLRRVADEAHRREIGHLYLFTHLVGFYEQFGWKFLEEFDTHVPQLGKQRLYVLENK